MNAEEWDRYWESLTSDQRREEIRMMDDYASLGAAGGCTWCKTGEPSGHDCAVRDHWLAIEDSERWPS